MKWALVVAVMTLTLTASACGDDDGAPGDTGGGSGDPGDSGLDAEARPGDTGVGGAGGTGGTNGDAGKPDAGETAVDGGPGPTDASGADEDGGTEMPDAGGDAGHGSAVAARTACYASCDRQIQDCSTIDIDDCRGLCDFVVAEMGDSAPCLELSIAAWECDLDQAWKCDPEQDVVGAPVDPAACAAEVAALEGAGCR